MITSKNTNVGNIVIKKISLILAKKIDLLIEKLIKITMIKEIISICKISIRFIFKKKKRKFINITKKQNPNKTFSKKEGVSLDLLLKSCPKDKKVAKRKYIRGAKYRLNIQLNDHKLPNIKYLI